MSYGGRGAGDVPSYLLSGVPYLSSSIVVPVSTAAPVEIDLTYVTRFVLIKNTISTGVSSLPIRVGFSAHGVKAVEGANYIRLDNGESFQGDFRVSKIFLSGEDGSSTSQASVVAGLTGIKGEEIYMNWSGSIGIG